MYFFFYIYQLYNTTSAYIFILLEQNLGTYKMPTVIVITVIEIFVLQQINIIKDKRGLAKTDMAQVGQGPLAQIPRDLKTNLLREGVS